MIREKSRVPQQVYTFKHVLTQETAYASILLSRRRDLHRRIAECLEETDPARVMDIARHFLEAGDNARALPYLVKAGDRANRAYSTPDAIRLYTQALDILETLPDSMLSQRVYEGLGSALVLAFDLPRALETYSRMMEVGQAQGNATMQISAHNKKAHVKALYQGQFPDAESDLAQAEVLARQADDRLGLAEMANIRCMMCSVRGDFEGMARHMGEVVQIAHEVNMHEQEVTGLAHVANALTYMTRFDEAWEKAQEAIALARNVGDRLHEAELLSYAIPLHYLVAGDLDTAQKCAEEGLTIAREIGALMFQVEACHTLGEIARLRGDYERAIEVLEEGIEASRPFQEVMPFYTLMPLASLGSAYIEMSDRFAPQATEMHSQALQMLDHPAGSPGGGTAWADIGFCALAVGNDEAASQMFEKGQSLPSFMGRINRPRFLLGSARVAMKHDQLEEALDHVGQARDFALERQMQYFYPEIYLTAGQARAARGEDEQALEQLEQAERYAAQMGMRPALWHAQAEAAQVLERLGWLDEARAKREAARAVVDEIAALLTDETRRTALLEQASRNLAPRQG